MDGEPEGHTQSVRLHIEHCKVCQQYLNEWQTASRFLNEQIDHALGPVDPLVALSHIHRRIAGYRARSWSVQVQQRLQELWLFHRHLFVKVGFLLTAGTVAIPLMLVAMHNDTFRSTLTTHQVAMFTFDPSKPVDLGLRIVYAHSNSQAFDDSLKAFAHGLGHLPYTAFELKAGAALQLTIGSTQGLAMPQGEWITFTPLAFYDDGALRVQIASLPFNFKTIVTLPRKTSITVPGPKYQAGQLIFVLIR
jgi:hypothetical protein